MHMHFGIYAPCAYVFKQNCTNIVWIINYYVMPLSLKFHKDPGDIRKVKLNMHARGIKAHAPISTYVSARFWCVHRFWPTFFGCPLLSFERKVKISYCSELYLQRYLQNDNDIGLMIDFQCIVHIFTKSSNVNNQWMKMDIFGNCRSKCNSLSKIYKSCQSYWSPL